MGLEPTVIAVYKNVCSSTQQKTLLICHLENEGYLHRALVTGHKEFYFAVKCFVVLLW